MSYGDKYRLKPGQPEFEITEGILRGRRFVHGKTYENIPMAYAQRFERFEEFPLTPCNGMTVDIDGDAIPDVHICLSLPEADAKDDPIIPVDIIPRYEEKTE